MTKLRHPRRLPACLLAVALAGCVSLTANAAEDLEGILVRFDEVQESIRTLSAEFRETTTNPLLMDPITAKGRFFMTKPDAIRWEYTAPEEMRFVIAQDIYTGYFPMQKRAEQRNIQRWSQHIFRFFGLGQGSKELGKFYDIALDQSRNEMPETYLLVLEPKKKRVRKRVEQAWFWLDASTYLPVKVEYRGREGNTRVVEFDDIRLNPDLSAALYTVELPADVKVSSGFSGLPSFDPDSTQ